MRILVATFIGVLACGGAASARGAGDAVKGKTAYADRKCAMCHKTDKNDQKGGKMGTVLADSAAKLSAADLKSWLTDTAKMEAKLAKKPAVSMSGYRDLAAEPNSLHSVFVFANLSLQNYH